MLIEAGNKLGQTVEVMATTTLSSGRREPASKTFRRIGSMPAGGWPTDKKWKEIGQLNKLSFVMNLKGYVL